MSTSTEPLKPIDTPSFEMMKLDPANPAADYKVWRKVSRGKREKIEWAVRQVAIRELTAVGALTHFNAQLDWIVNNARECPYSRIAILKFLIEAPPKAKTVEELYDDLSSETVNEMIEDFTVSSIGERIIAAILDSQKKSQPASQSTVDGISSGLTSKKNRKRKNSIAS